MILLRLTSLHALIQLACVLFVFVFNSVSCAGLYNIYMGDRKAAVSLLYKYVNIGNNREYCFGSYNGCPSLIVVNCLKVGTFEVEVRNGGGLRCSKCHEYYSTMKGSKHIGTKVVKNWEYKLSKCLE